MLNHRRSRSQSFRAVGVPLLALSGVLAVPMQAFADSQSARELASLNSAAARMTSARLEPEKRPDFEQLAKDASLSPQAKACWLLVEDRMNLVVNAEAEKEKVVPPAPWYPFAGTQQQPAPTEKWLTECYSLSGSFEPYMKATILGSCQSLQQTPICKDWAMRLSGALPVSRKFGGGLLIGLGAASIILGVLHLSFPLFQLSTESTLAECSANGLRVPCVANRPLTGALLIGIGAATVTGGGLTLGLRL